VKHLLSLSGTPQADAADALAVALCHAIPSKALLIWQGKHVKPCEAVYANCFARL